MRTRRIRQRVAILAIFGLGLGVAASRSEAGAWVLPQGRSYFQIKLLHQDTEERYFLEGERIPYFFEGRSRPTALVVDYAGPLEASGRLHPGAGLQHPFRRPGG